MCDASTLFSRWVNPIPCQRETQDGEQFCYYHNKMSQSLIEPLVGDMHDPLLVTDSTGKVLWRKA